MELGITTFAETYPEGGDGAVPSHGERLRQVVAEARAAEQAGLVVYGVGEHHRQDFAASAPVVVLATIAGATSTIRLTSAVTVLSSADPVRVFQEFATLDLLSSGRAELMAGRGSFVESFPLFGYSIDDYDELFAEKLDLLLEVRRHERVTWSGKFRPPLRNQSVFPRPAQRPLPVWVAVGGSPDSVVRAGVRGLPVALAIIGGEPARFAPLAELHRHALTRAGFDPESAPLAVHAHGFVAATTEEAVETYFAPYAHAMSVIGRERGWGPMSRDSFDVMRSPQGSLVLGNPEQVAEKIVAMRESLGIQRFMLHLSVGTLPHAEVLRAIELFGSEVGPLVEAAGRSTPRP